MAHASKGIRRAKPRATAGLVEKLDKRLLAYATAAAAAGVGAMAAAQPAEAEVVYTPQHTTLGHACNECGPSVYPIDFTNNGVAELLLVSFFGVSTNFAGSTLEVYPCYCKSPNAEVGTQGTRFALASALPAGVQVGPNLNFIESSKELVMGARAVHLTNSGKVKSTNFYGKWANGGKGVDNKYLGVKFMLDGGVHYGWVRLTISNKIKLISGWAYETVANQPVTTGFGQGDEASDAPGAVSEGSKPSASLGALALGRQ